MTEPSGSERPTPPRRTPRPDDGARSSNGIFVGLVIGVALVGAAYWTITSLHDWDRLQICATSGRSDCGNGR